MAAPGRPQSMCFSGVLYEPGCKCTAPFKECSLNTLVNICCKNIVRCSTVTLGVVQCVPTTLFPNLLKSAICTGNSAAIDVIIRHWPERYLVARDVMPSGLGLQVLYNDITRDHRLKWACERAWMIVHCFLHGFQEDKLKKLRVLDLSGIPTGDRVAKILADYLKNDSALDPTLYRERRKSKDGKKGKKAVKQNQLHEKYTVKADVLVTEEAILALRSLTGVTWKRLSVILSRVSTEFIQSTNLVHQLRQLSTEHLQALSAKYVTWTTPGRAAFCGILGSFTKLTGLDLTMGSDMEVGEDVLRALKQLPLLTSLDLSGWTLRRRLFKVLEALQKSLLYLRLPGCLLQPEDIRVLARSPHAKTLTFLDVSANNMGNSVMELAELLYNASKSLAVLEIEYAGLTSAYMSALCRPLKQLKCLEHLNISSNTRIGQDCLTSRCFLELLNQKSLTSLKVSCSEDFNWVGNGDEDPVEAFTQLLGSAMSHSSERKEYVSRKIVVR